MDEDPIDDVPLTKVLKCDVCEEMVDQTLTCDAGIELCLRCNELDFDMWTYLMNTEERDAEDNDSGDGWTTGGA